MAHQGNWLRPNPRNDQAKGAAPPNVVRGLRSRWCELFTPDGINVKTEARRGKVLVLSGREIPAGSWFVPPGSNRSSSRGNEAAEAFGVEGRIGDLASVQAVT